MKKIIITITLLVLLIGSAFAESMKTTKNFDGLEYTVEWNDESSSIIDDWTWGYIYAKLESKYEQVQVYRPEECGDCAFQRFGIKYSKMFWIILMTEIYSFSTILRCFLLVFMVKKRKLMLK